MNDLRERISRVFDMVQAAGWMNNAPDFNKESIEAIKELAKECRESKLYIENAPNAPEWIKTESAGELWINMCIKINRAPTRLHALSAPCLMIPFIADALEREGK